MPLDPREILAEISPEAIPLPQPPAVANYRDADLQGVACAFCAKFDFVSERLDEDGFAIPVGFCEQWEASVDGVHVCDRFASGPPSFDENGDEVWEFAEGQRGFAEIHLSGTDQQEDQGYVLKEILRTGEWPMIPIKGGHIKKPLKIVRDGRSNPETGTIALAELVANFEARALDNVQIPLSDDTDDHKNLTRTNTGFVRDLWIIDEGDESKLMAKMEFTEPEVKEKVLRGTYADVSCGIPWNIVARGKLFGSTLEHVAITNRPFIDNLGPFLAASDATTEAEVAHFGDVQVEEEQEEREEARETEEPEIPALSAAEIYEGAYKSLRSAFGLSGDYFVIDSYPDKVKVRNRLSETTWMVPFTVEEGEISLAALKDWEVIEDEGTESEPSPRSSTPLSELEEARRLRELRFSQSSTTHDKEGNMPLTREDLERLELSDDARAAFQSVLNENANLRASTRESEADRRVGELEEMGLKDRPGALKFYRQVMLSDDGGPAAVVLSDNGHEKEQMTALEILDRFIDGIKDADNKVVLSDQHLASGNDNKPPVDATEEVVPLEERVKSVRESLYGETK